MRVLRAWLLRVAGLFGKEQRDLELAEELEAHLQMYIDQGIRAGMTQVQARREALIKLGGIEQTKENYRDQRGVRWLETLWQDLRFGTRVLSRNPGFTCVTVFTLALGIGANTAIFSFADLIIRRPVALPEMNRLVAVSELLPSTGEKGISPANYLDLQSSAHNVEALAAYQFWGATLSRRGNFESVAGVRVTPNFFSTIGVQPTLGRGFSEDEGELGQDRVLVISDAFWKQQFAGRKDVLGKEVELSQQRFTVIGVMPAKSTFPLGAPKFWMPLALSPQEKSERTELSLSAVGRLASEASVGQSRAEVEAHWGQMQKAHPEANNDRTIQVVQLLDDIVLDYNRDFALLLLSIAGFVLLIACANTANLQLARGAGRQREIAIRASLGAGGGRILRQLATESVLLASLGGVVGLLLAFWGVHVLRVTLPADVREFCDVNDLRINRTSLLFTLLISFVAGLLAGIFPACQLKRDSVLDALKQGGGRIAGGQGTRLRAALVIGELSLAVVLLIGAALMVKGFAALANANPALAPDELLTIHVDLPAANYGQALEAKSFSDEALARLQSLPGAESVAMASGVPYSFYDDSMAVRLQGQADVPPERLLTVMPESVSPAYFRTLHIRLRQGREFEARDTADSPPIAIVSESMAQRFWPGESPIGKKVALVRSSAPSREVTVVGVVGDILHEVYDHSFRSVLYLPYGQAPPHSMDFVLRASSSAPELLSMAGGQIREMGADIPVSHLETMTQKIANQTSGLRYVAQLVAVFGIIALILSVVGVYSLMAYSVRKRQGEIGIRMALGAQTRDIVALVMRSGFFLTVIGLVIGVLLALALTRLVADLIYGVSSWDATVFTVVPALLASVALMASYVPAHRAASAEAIDALRCG